MMQKLNLIIGIDTVNCNIKVMRILGKDAKSAHVDYLPIDPAMLDNQDWGVALSMALPEYIKGNPFDNTFAVWMVLPDTMVALDLIPIPMISRSKINGALESQMKELYSFYKGYKFNRFQLCANKTNAIYQVTMVSKQVLSSFYKVLSDNRMYVKNATYSAAATSNAVFSLRPKTRRDSFLIMDIKSDYTLYSVCSNGLTTGFSFLPFGHNILINEKILPENMLYNDTLSHIAVINAAEKAKRKKMTTVDDTEIDSEIIDEASLSVKELSANAQATECGEGESQPAEQPVEEKQAKPQPKPKVFAKKPTRLPLFMQRPVPQDREGFVYENFRIFVKKALLICRQNSLTEGPSDISYVLVNIPKDYSFVVDRLKEEGVSTEFRYFDYPKDDNVHFRENLDLYGALFMDTYNKKNTF